MIADWEDDDALDAEEHALSDAFAAAWALITA